MKVVISALVLSCLVTQSLGQSYDGIERVLLSLIHNSQEQTDINEDRIRMEGDSGIMQTRRSRTGTASFFSQTHAGPSVASIHEHANNIRTIGMGEVCAVLNGVHFCTRHNDFGLYMPHREDNTYGATEKVPYPDVPDSIRQLPVNEQIPEMQEYFKAWATQNKTHRNYVPYFKPVLCYMEGAWTIDEGNITESFFSDRHVIEAKTWYELQKKFRYTAYTGTKNQLENFATLPKKIMDITKDEKTGLSLPSVAQWNYDIKCHPLNRDLPLNRFRVIDDLSTRMMNGEKNMQEFVKSRAARFQLDPFDDGQWRKDRYNPDRWGLLDKLMYEIPGKDNYKRTLRDNSFGDTAQRLDKDAPINAAYYHRWYKVTQKGAMGLQVRARGFADANLFVAFNTQDKIHSVHVSDCDTHEIKKSGGNVEKCPLYKAKVSYAIPLEIIYMTPLLTWNPFNIEVKGWVRSAEALTVTADHRNGAKTLEKAYNGTHDALHYITPDSFFSGSEVSSDAADTSKGAVGVLDKDGNPRFTRSSGTRIFLPNIPGVGVLRTRYPIVPIHDDGSVIMKELEALKRIVLEPMKYAHMFRESPSFQSGQSSNDQNGGMMTLQTTGSGADHVHTITLTPEEVTLLMADESKTVVKTTSTANTHNHLFTLNYARYRFRMIKCDGKDYCTDRHGRVLDVVKSK